MSMRPRRPSQFCARLDCVEHDARAGVGIREGIMVVELDFQPPANVRQLRGPHVPNLASQRHRANELLPWGSAARCPATGIEHPAIERRAVRGEEVRIAEEALTPHAGDCAFMRSAADWYNDHRFRSSNSGWRGFSHSRTTGRISKTPLCSRIHMRIKKD